MTNPDADWREVLATPIVDAEVEWRVDQIHGNSVRLLAYIDARAAMFRLDSAVGPECWKDVYGPHPQGDDKGVLCILSLAVGGTTGMEWVSKSDVGTPSRTEGEKGAVSDAFKRACVKWGIGRNLYELPTTWVDIQSAKPKGIDRRRVVRVADKRTNTYGWAVAPLLADLMAPTYEERGPSGGGGGGQQAAPAARGGTSRQGGGQGQGRPASAPQRGAQAPSGGYTPGPHRTCPACGADGRPHRFAADDHAKGSKAPDMECSACQETYRGKTRATRFWSNDSKRDAEQAPPPADEPPVDAYDEEDVQW